MFVMDDSENRVTARFAFIDFDAGIAFFDDLHFV